MFSIKMNKKKLRADNTIKEKLTQKEIEINGDKNLESNLKPKKIYTQREI